VINAVLIGRGCWPCVLNRCMTVRVWTGILTAISVVDFVSKLTNKPDYYYYPPISIWRNYCAFFANFTCSAPEN